MGKHVLGGFLAIRVGVSVLLYPFIHFRDRGAPKPWLLGEP